VNVQVALDSWPECGALGHFWSLAVEEQFYLLWPLVIFLFRGRSIDRICAACIVGALLIRIAFVAAGEGTAA
jgi:peptidoglycan/LPS O-acetylase OafA/YrhL